MSEDTTYQDGGLIDVSDFTLRRLADEVDESSLAATLRRLLDPSEGYGDEIASFNAALPFE
jgi:FXSXX-COOH protein